MRCCRATNAKPLPSSSRKCCRLSISACSSSISTSRGDSGRFRNSSTSGSLQRVDRLRHFMPARGQPQQAVLVAALGQAVEQQAGHLALQLARRPGIARRLDLVERRAPPGGPRAAGGGSASTRGRGSVGPAARQRRSTAAGVSSAVRRRPRARRFPTRCVGNSPPSAAVGQELRILADRSAGRAPDCPRRSRGRTLRAAARPARPAAPCRSPRGACRAALLRRSRARSASWPSPAWC